MHTLSAAELLSIWEQGQAALPVQRGLALMAAAVPNCPIEALASLSIGRRDGLLLRLRQVNFGPQLESLADCPKCAAKLEMVLPVSSLFLPASAAGEGIEASADELELTGERSIQEDKMFSIEANGYQVSFRLPNSLDLLELAFALDNPVADGLEDDGETASRLLLERCLLAVSHQGRDLERPLSTHLPPGAAGSVLKKMEEADPQASSALKLHCPTCGHEWEAGFDILSFFWIEIQAWACRILQEVHTLALAYGWREGDILAMSALRRQAYLEMLSR